MEEQVLSGGIEVPERLPPEGLLSPSPEEGVEGLGHDVRGARTVINTGGSMIAEPVNRRDL